jgi:hypothetical protein
VQSSAVLSTPLLRAPGTSDFDIVVSKGQALLDGPSVSSMAQLVLHLASADKFPVTSSMSAAD